ncbi:type II toxin-antitoxin system RelB/DinJ family antitoxin [Acerihabitans arboris]|uniref:Type II toxin-antitoxin system RelB/DinJ family antitoxin n=1 Tax=Acerihabitans arboris TaxID=2691583 RepID=A0A845SM49_9GAMM|nr:type II toxin-antitoxin system RelB/DinJ family antitoxin [Acerihabitans arboris]NDL64297.1 type II toxin-antitoxin system RelB/DinJ family antitoxin [Acerihabitans arboris]
MQTSIKARISDELKDNASQVLSDCGLNVSTAIRLFLEQVVKHQGLPFEISNKPSAKTAAALKEATEIERADDLHHSSIESMLGSMRRD